MLCTGKELRVVLDFLRETFPKYWEISDIAEATKLSEAKIATLITYTIDMSLTFVLESSPDRDVAKEVHRVSGKGIDKLNKWATEDDELII